VFSPATVTTRIDRWLKREGSAKGLTGTLSLAVHPAVAAYMTKDNAMVLRKLEREHKVKIEIAEDGELDQDEFEFSRTNSGSRRKKELQESKG
jgi:hypothetical protein